MNISKKHVYFGISLLLFIATLTINATIGQSMINLSAVFPFPLMPAGWVFGVAWGTIYLALVGFMGGLRKLPLEKKGKEIHHLFWISCIFNIGWIVVTEFQAYAVSVFFLLGLTLVLIDLLKKIAYVYLPLPWHYFLHIPIGLYLGRAVTATFILGGSQLLHLANGLEWSAHPYWIVSILPITALITGRLRRKFRYRSVLVLVAVAVGSLCWTYRNSIPLIAGIGMGSLMLLCGVMLVTLLTETKDQVVFYQFLLLLAIFCVLSIASKDRMWEAFKVLRGIA